jgi:hypothetical protein
LVGDVVVLHGCGGVFYIRRINSGENLGIFPTWILNSLLCI